MGEREGIGFLHWFRIPDEPGEPRPPPPPKQEPDEDGFVFQIINAELDGTTAQFDFPGAWGLELRDVKSPASLLIEGDFVGWDAQGLVARGRRLPEDPGGRAARSTGWRWPASPRIRESPDNILLDVTAARTGRSRAGGQGTVHRHLRLWSEARRSRAAERHRHARRDSSGGGRADGGGRRAQAAAAGDRGSRVRGGRSEGRLRAAEDRRAHRGAGRRLRPPVPGAGSRAGVLAGSG